MKISANIEISNRNHAGLAGNCRRRAVYSTLAIGKLSGDYKIQYFARSLGAPKVYNVKNNIEKVFTKFIKEGKSTIRFISPPEDIKISHNDSKTLMSFITILIKVLKNETIHTTHVLNSNDNKIPSRPVTSLTVNNIDSYWHEFPRTLVSLKAASLNLDDIGNKIRPLFNLSHLDLSDNNLADLPEYLGNLPITHLNVGRNRLSMKSNWSWMKRPCIQKTLISLKLSDNRIGIVPPQLYKFKNIESLYLAATEIVIVPFWLCSFGTLKMLDLGGNTLAFVPASIGLLQIEQVCEPFYHTALKIKPSNEGDPLENRQPPSLKSQAAKHVYPYRRLLSNKMCPEEVIFYLFNNGNLCKCGKFVFSDAWQQSFQIIKNEIFMFKTMQTDVSFRVTAFALYQKCITARTKKCL